MHFNPEINVGNLITIAVALFGFGVWFTQVTTSIKVLTREVDKYASLLQDFMSESRIDRESIHRQLDRLAKQKKARDEPG